MSPPVCCTLLPCSAAPSTSGSLRSFAGKTSCVFYVDPVCATVADCKCKPLAEWLPGDILSSVLPRQTTPLDYLVYCRPSAVNDSKSGRCPPSLSQFLVARSDDSTTHPKSWGHQRAACYRAAHPVLIPMQFAYACNSVVMLSPNRSRAMLEGFALFVLYGLGACQRKSACYSLSCLCST